jgi:hypothetical protein
MATREVNLIVKDYCYRRKIKDVKEVTFVHQRVDRITGNQVFLVSRDGTTPEIYEHKRLDVKPYSQQKSLWFPKDLQGDREAMLNKTSMAGWINRQVNLELLPEDIGVLSLVGTKLTVVMSPNSMRFQSSFVISFL